jgi:hypothetical protein
MKDIVRKAKKAIKQNPEMFAVLDEYDRTGKLRKLSYKERANFTIDSELLIKFRAHCRANGFNMSAKIEQFMKKEVS